MSLCYFLSNFFTFWSARVRHRSHLSFPNALLLYILSSIFVYTLLCLIYLIYFLTISTSILHNAEKVVSVMIMLLFSNTCHLVLHSLMYYAETTIFEFKICLLSFHVFLYLLMQGIDTELIYDIHAIHLNCINYVLNLIYSNYSFHY